MSQTQGDFSIVNKTRMQIPVLPFALLKEDILGKKYSISIALVDEKTIHKINKEHRNKDKPTNVLSFLLSKKDGELILCPSLIKKESKDPEKNFGKSFESLLLFLVIHGMLHLKGYEHSSRMDKAETFYCKKYAKKHINRNRHRLINDKSRGGRIPKRRKNS